MSKIKTKLSQFITDIKYSIANRRAAVKEERRIKKSKCDRFLKGIFDKEEFSSLINKYLEK